MVTNLEINYKESYPPMVFGIQHHNTTTAAAVYNATTASNQPSNGTTRGARQALMLAVTAAAFAKMPGKAGNHSTSAASTAMGTSGGAVQPRAPRATSGALQHLLMTRPRVRESARAPAAGAFNATQSPSAPHPKASNATRPFESRASNGTEKPNASLKTEETKERCGARKTANALVQVGGLSKESNKTKEREVLKKFSSCFTQPYRQSVVTANPATYKACQELGLEDYFGFIVQSSKPYYEKAKEFESLANTTHHAYASDFLKEKFPELWTKAEGLIKEGKISENTAACLSFGAYVNAKSENLAMQNSVEFALKINTTACDTIPTHDEKMQCIKDAKESILKEIFGGLNKDIEDSSGVERNSYAGKIYKLNTLPNILCVSDGSQISKLFDLAKGDNITEISPGGSIVNSKACTYLDHNFKDEGHGAANVAAYSFWHRYADTLTTALNKILKNQLTPDDNKVLAGGLGKDNNLRAFSSDYDYDYYDDDNNEGGGIGPTAESAVKTEQFTPEQRQEISTTKTRLSNAVKMTNALAAWAMKDQQGRPLTGQGTHVAIFDTGTDKTSPFLANASIESLCVSRDDGAHNTLCADHKTSLRRNTSQPEAYLCANGEDKYLCDHGTAAASAIVGSYGNKYYGVAPGATILAVSHLDTKTPSMLGMVISMQSPWFYTQVLEDILKETATKKIAALSMSFSISRKYGGGDDASEFPVVQAMFDALRSQGVVSVCAIGNSKEITPDFPGYFKDIVRVGACRHLDDGSVVKASYSGFGPEVDIYALSKIRVANSGQPEKLGVDGVSKRTEGTSFSTPLVSGALSILRQQAGDQIPKDQLASAMTWALYHRADASDWHKVDGTNLRPVLDIKVACQNMQKVLNGTFNAAQLPGSDEHGQVTSFKEFLPLWQAWRDKNPPSSRDKQPNADGQTTGGFGAGAALAALGLALGAASGAGCAVLSHKNRRKQRHEEQRAQESHPLTHQTTQASAAAKNTLRVSEMETVV